MTRAPAILNALPLARRLKRDPAEHKGDAGKVVLIGGASGMAGALLLAGNACMHLGAGWTILEMLDPSSANACMDHPELMIRLANAEAMNGLPNINPNVIAIGPGLGISALALSALEKTLNIASIPLVIDADALNLIASSKALLKALRDRNQQFPSQTVLTPHPGEAAQLLQCSSTDIQSDRLGSIEKLVELTDSIVVLKGQNTLLASPLKQILLCEQGNSGMGTGGMGISSPGALLQLQHKG